MKVSPRSSARLTGLSRIPSPGFLASDGHGDALIRLQTNDQLVGGSRGARHLEYRVRHLFECHNQLGQAILQPLAGAQIERYARPSARCRCRPSVATKVSVLLSRGDVGLLQVARNRAPRTAPALYWPRTDFVSTSRSHIGRKARSTLNFSSRTASAALLAGGSMAMMHSSCSR